MVPHYRWYYRVDFSFLGQVVTAIEFPILADQSIHLNYTAMRKIPLILLALVFVLTSCDDYGKKMTMYYKGDDVKETEVNLADSYFVSYEPVGEFTQAQKNYLVQQGQQSNSNIEQTNVQEQVPTENQTPVSNNQ
jgi:hypothetical protein